MQPPSEAEQRTTLEGVVRVLWRVTAADEEDPDYRAAIDAVLHPPAPPPPDLSEEDSAGKATATPHETPSTRSTTPKDTESTAASGQERQGGEHTHDGSSAPECRLVWPQTDVEFWQRVESMLDIGGGCAVVGNADFAGWVCSLLQCRPAL